MEEFDKLKKQIELLKIKVRILEYSIPSSTTVEDKEEEELNRIDRALESIMTDSVKLQDIENLIRSLRIEYGR